MKVATGVFHTTFYYISICGTVPHIAYARQTNLRGCPLGRGPISTNTNLLQ